MDHPLPSSFVAVEPWIVLTLVAAAFQAVRTAAQKQLTANLSIGIGTYVRSLLGLPVMLVVLLGVKLATAAPWPQLTPAFWAYVTVTAITQVVATAALLSLYQLRSFAVVNQIGKSDMIFTAVIGSLAFAQPLNTVAWFALGLTGTGVAMIMTGQTAGIAGRASWRDMVTDTAIGLGLFVGLMFGICNLALREATLALHSNSNIMAGVVTVCCVTAVQTVSVGIWLAAREPTAYQQITRSFALASFVGVTSALGSVFWFIAFAMTAAANVRIVGQIEVVFTLAISVYYFQEKLTRWEVAGIFCTIAGILILQAVR